MVLAVGAIMSVVFSYLSSFVVQVITTTINIAIGIIQIYLAYWSWLLNLVGDGD